MIYIVLGMHKSGTTLISKTLHESGINMGDFDADVGYDEGNKYERMETLITNISLLNIQYKALSIYVTRAVENEKEVSQLLITYIKRLITELNRKHIDWGFKDPRTCLTYNIWQKYLPKHKIIVVIRSPLEIISHYQKKFSLLTINKTWRVSKTWYIYNKQILAYLKNTSQDYIIINYQDFLKSDNVFEALSKYTEGNLKDLRDKRLYRSKPQNTLMLRSIFLLQRFLCKRDLNRLYDDLKNYAKRSPFI